MNPLLNRLTHILTNVTTTDDITTGYTDHLAVVIKPIPKESRKLLSKQNRSVSCFALKWHDKGLLRDPNGTLIAHSSYTEEGCRIMRVGMNVPGHHFTAEYLMEIRNIAEHDAITASEQLGRKLLTDMTAFCEREPEHVETEKMITRRNPERLQLVAFNKDHVSIWIPRKGVNDGNWMGYIHLDIVNQVFSYELYDEVVDEFLTIPDAWNNLDIEKTEFFVQSLIDKPVLPRNINGMLY